MIEKSCLECGTVFQSYPSQQRKYCSARCGALGRIRSQKAAGTYVRPNKLRRGTETPCEVCGTTVYANQSTRAKGLGRYCSQVCHNVAQSKEAVIKDCDYCGKEMRLKPSQAVRQFCSKACEADGRTKRPLDRIHNGRRARLNEGGYILLYEPNHPNKTLKGWQPEHRLVVEKVLGRYLRSDEAVHHINGIKTDNRPENLEVMDALDHARLSVGDYWNSVQEQLKELAAYRRRYGPLTEEPL